MSELDQMNPGAGGNLPPVDHEQEGAMAKADLHKLANYSFKLFKKLGDDDQLEAWVQAKITKAADYIASVYHYLEYEMQFSEYGHHLDNSDTLSEGQKAVLRNKLMEAKEKIKTLKIAQAEKTTISEGPIFGGHEQACGECGGTGVIQMPIREVPDHVKAKVEKYNRQAKAFHAAGKRIDKNKNGIPDDEEFEEGFDEKSKSGDTFKTRTGVATKTSTGVVHKNTSHSDEEHGEANTTHAKSRSAADKRSDAPKQKKSKSGTWGMEGGEKFDNRKKEKEVEEGQGGGIYGQGVYEGKKSKKADKDYDGDGKVESGKDEYLGSKIAAAKKAGKMDEALKGKQKKLDVDDDGDIEADDLADLRAGKKKEEKVDEAKAKPSAGMSKGEKSAVVKKAKAGGDIGKPGKSFDKVAKAAGGGEKGKKIAAAAMWKNAAKESVEPQQEMIAESAEVARIRELTQKLLG